jgi:transposase
VILLLAMSIDDSLPTDLASAHALIIAQRQALSAAEMRATVVESEAQYRALLIEKLKFTIRKLRHERFGQSAERGTISSSFNSPIWRRMRRKRTRRAKWQPRRLTRR